MNIIQLVFSPTGGTKRAADLLSKGLGDTIRTIDLTDAALQSVDLDNDLLYAMRHAVSPIGQEGKRRGGRRCGIGHEKGVLREKRQ